MQRRTMLVGLLVLAAAAVWVAAIATADDEKMPKVNGPTNPDLASQGVVWHGNDLGIGERLLLVIGGSFPTEAAARAANQEIRFGDLQGYYVAETDQFSGLRQFLGDQADEFVLVTGFRTDAGAREFLQLAEASEQPALLTQRLENRGDVYVGLGQEAHPDGTGPLIGPLQGVST